MRLLFFIFIISLFLSNSQNTFINKKNETHLCGPVDIESMKQDTSYADWFDKDYTNLNSLDSNIIWKNNLKDIKVEIFFGTWCGDSKKNVPEFIKLWDHLGFSRDQLSLIAVYDNTDKSKNKTSPNNEELGKYIHRVPTFIFYKNNQEIARIVEHPVNSLEIDLSQIALGVPSTPNYKASNYILKILAENDISYIDKNKEPIISDLKPLCKNDNELNAIGYFFVNKNELENALIVFELNISLFEKTPNVYDSYAETLALLGRKEEAITNYKKVLELDPENKNAKEQLDKLIE